MTTCPYCNKPAELVTGEAIYPHRPDLAKKQFWRCVPCKAYVGCHARNRKHGYTGIEPLGRLANAELRTAKREAHDSFDPLWRDLGMTRKEAYTWLANQLCIPFDDCHIGMFDVEQCRRVKQLCNKHCHDVLIQPFSQVKP